MGLHIQQKNSNHTRRVSAHRKNCSTIYDTISEMEQQVPWRDMTSAGGSCSHPSTSQTQTHAWIGTTRNTPQSITQSAKVTHLCSKIRGERRRQLLSSVKAADPHTCVDSQASAGCSCSQPSISQTQNMCGTPQSMT